MSENKFSDRLSEAIKASGKTQTEVAREAGITAPYLSDLKKGHKGNPSQEVLRKLADSLETTPAWLMSYKDNAGIHVVGGTGWEHIREDPIAKNEAKAKDSNATGRRKIEPSEDPMRQAKLAAGLERNTALEPWAEVKLTSVMESLGAILYSVPFNDGEMVDGLIELCHKRLDRFGAEVKAYRAKAKE